MAELDDEQSFGVLAALQPEQDSVRQQVVFENMLHMPQLEVKSLYYVKYCSNSTPARTGACVAWFATLAPGQVLHFHQSSCYSTAARDDA